MKLLLVSLVIMATIAVNICDTNAIPQPSGGFPLAAADMRSESEAPAMEGKLSI